ncbi:hydrogenase nickel incorporation protein HypB [Dehalogenimonas alkenigignens]|uniref:Hydrogenase nickel incorporation protein HypB n=1 Tax=Dehalogenimonas alkenigignens TaxID=1217799 RepID=A0A0W0GG93_9CHLR|nr:hydrogenase nickel incorporation protein HypB [Dehalogenimonas alkenigignens]KTB47588.1 Hydrogenase nickel incorporation protein HypB [Dehalogenimonas alkenigignens]PVV82911.1 hydrogenase accessory protein HypB [Dehalogenimonas alkenigignens]
MQIKVLKDIMAANTATAEANRARLDNHGILGVNIMASPGAGKTTFILATIDGFRPDARVGVIEGDIASQIDSEKVAQKGAPVVQINTGGGCHLDAGQVSAGLDNLPLENIDVLFIENVGNLVCPSEFKLGEHLRVVLLSVPEGDDKPFKYPGMFASADAVIVTKTDILPYFDFDLGKFTRSVEGLKPGIRVFPLSARTGHGFSDWIAFLKSQIPGRGS